MTSPQQAVLLAPTLNPWGRGPHPLGNGSPSGQVRLGDHWGSSVGQARWGQLTFHHLRDAAVGVDAADVFGVGRVGAAVKDQGCGRGGRARLAGPHNPSAPSPLPFSSAPPLLLTLLTLMPHAPTLSPLTPGPSSPGPGQSWTFVGLTHSSQKFPPHTFYIIFSLLFCYTFKSNFYLLV